MGGVIGVSSAQPCKASFKAGDLQPAAAPHSQAASPTPFLLYQGWLVSTVPPPPAEVTDSLGSSTFSLLLPQLYTLCPGSVPQVSSLPVPWAVDPVVTVFRAQHNLALFLSAT